MPFVKELKSGKEVVCEKGQTLLPLLTQHGIYVNNPCNGKGTCGKCKIKVVSGQVSEPSEEEKKKLATEELEKGIRLACMTEVVGDCQIETEADSRKMKVLNSGYIPEFQIEAHQAGYGVAVDIGTTTIAMNLVDLQTGEIIGQEAGMNAQRAYGQDVLTRITYEMEQGEEGVKRLQESVVGSINQGIAAMCIECGIQTETIAMLSIAGNCTMIHMLLGVDARSIGVAPYKPAFLEAQYVEAKEIGITAGEGAMVYCLAQVSGYIGGDILAGAKVCDLKHRERISLFLDIGTNGEMILANRGKLFACSCTAGPALEGMNITCGMPALPGAIERVEMKGHKLYTDTIAKEAAKGICGSGILEVVSVLVENEFIKRTGAFVKTRKLEDDDWRKAYLTEDENGPAFLLAAEEKIIVTQKDVRQVQLAKGAILSGFISLLKQAEIEVEDLEEVIIAGQFGSHLSAEALTSVGIIPKSVKDKVKYVGNTSKTGAYMALLSGKIRQEMESLAKDIEYFELAESEGYEQLFMECMRF